MFLPFQAAPAPTAPKQAAPRQVAPNARANTVVGRLEILRFESKALGSRTLRVWLPPQFDDKSAAKSPVLVMHDGQNLFDGATSFIPGGEWRVDESATMLIEAKLIPPIVVVGIDNAGAERGNEYVPTRFRMRDAEIGGKGDAYLKMIDEEVFPMLKAKFGLETKRFGMAGSSLGGVISLYAGTKFGARLDRIAALSPSVWVNGREPLAWAAKIPKSTRVWLDVGDHEGSGADDDVLALRDAFAKADHPVACAVEPNAEHNESAWARRFPAVLLDLYGR